MKIKIKNFIKLPYVGILCITLQQKTKAIDAYENYFQR